MTISIAASSDWHGVLPLPIIVPACNLLLLAGDYELHTENDLALFNDFLKHVAKKVDHLLFIPGNHDLVFKHKEITSKYEYVNKYLLGHLEVVHIGNLSIQGFWWSSAEDIPAMIDQWAFMDTDAAIKSMTNKLLPTDILLSHSPPKHTVDYVNWQTAIGIPGVNVQDYKLIICGHVHEQKGQNRAYENTKVYNVSSQVCDFTRINLDVGN